MDSLIWQAGKIIYSEGFNKEKSIKSLYKYFTGEIGLDDEISNKLSTELTIFIEKVNRRY